MPMGKKHASMYRAFARWYVSVRECVVTTRSRREVQEEILADLNSCLEELESRAVEIEERIGRYEEHAAQHMRASKARGSQSELLRAKMFMQDRRRLRAEHEKTVRIVHLLETQIDGIMASNVDAMVIQTMRSYNSTASQLAFPALTTQLENLSDQLSDRTHEIGALQEALNNVANVTIPEGAEGMDDASLMQELEALLMTAEPSAAPAASSSSSSDKEPVGHLMMAEPSLTTTTPAAIIMVAPSPPVVLPSPPPPPPQAPSSPPSPPPLPAVARPASNSSSIVVVSSRSFGSGEEEEALPG